MMKLGRSDVMFLCIALAVGAIFLSGESVVLGSDIGRIRHLSIHPGSVPVFSEVASWDHQQFFRIFRDAVRNTPEPLLHRATRVNLSEEDLKLLSELDKAARRVLGAEVEQPFEPRHHIAIRATRTFSDPSDNTGLAALWDALGYSGTPLEINTFERRPLAIMKAAGWTETDLKRISGVLSRPLIMLEIARKPGSTETTQTGWQQYWAEFIAGLSASVLLPGAHIDTTHSLWAALGLNHSLPVEGSAGQLVSALRRQPARLGDWEKFLEDIRLYLDNPDPDASFPTILRVHGREKADFQDIHQAARNWPMMSLHKSDRNILIRYFLAHLALMNFSEWRVEASGADGWTIPSEMREIIRSEASVHRSEARIIGVELLAENARRYRFGEDISRVSQLRAMVWRNPDSTSFRDYDFLQPFTLWKGVDYMIALENMRYYHARMERSMLPEVDRYLRWLATGQRETTRLASRIAGASLHDRVEMTARRLSALAIRDRVMLLNKTASRMYKLSRSEYMSAGMTPAAQRRQDNIEWILARIKRATESAVDSTASQAATAAGVLTSDRF